MPKVRDVLVDVKVEQARRQRKCRRCKAHVITKGEMCLVVRTNATRDDYSYCLDAAKPMLDAAWIKLKAFYVELGVVPPT
ncbi:hypothetical protein ACVIW2_005920 [Bradyrhizobium huanghuaihaiense]